MIVLKESLLDTITDRPYENCVSLGWYCGTASSLSKLGLRSRSGPFDWLESSLWGVIAQIENGFVDFMSKDNIEIVDNSGKIFEDAKYDFHCNHDVKNNFDEEYSKIHERYMRRAVSFLEMIKQPTIFYRCIKDDDEVKFINSNWRRIDELLKSYNSNNQIIYICHSRINGLVSTIKVFNLKVNQYIGKTYEMRHLFDTCMELVEFSESLISIEQMQKNINYDNITNAQIATAAYVCKCVDENIDGIEKSILSALGVTAETGIYLWGAGNLGITLAQYLYNKGVVVKGIIDKEQYGQTIENCKIISPEDVPFGAKIFISILDKDANNAIISQLQKSNTVACIKRYEDLYEEDIDI